MSQYGAFEEWWLTTEKHVGKNAARLAWNEAISLCKARMGDFFTRNPLIFTPCKTMGKDPVNFTGLEA